MSQHLRAIFSLPFVVLVIIPSVLLLFTPEIDTRWDISMPVYRLIFLTGLVLLLAGMILLAITVYLFASVGEGTLAPGDPTEKLVIQGPYQHMRNPMITGVLTALIGESVLTGSWTITLWATLFLP
jgi:protein-S-isoprenylcysteine O-methyltransferase Ste14